MRAQLHPELGPCVPDGTSDELAGSIGENLPLTGRFGENTLRQNIGPNGVSLVGCGHLNAISLFSAHRAHVLNPSRKICAKLGPLS